MKHKAVKTAAALTGTAAAVLLPMAPTWAKTVTGPSTNTAYGPVQVSVNVKGGKLVSVSTPVYPKETPKSTQINNKAIPKLQKAAVKKQSANITNISGATYTTKGFKKSLQAALKKAGL